MPDLPNYKTILYATDLGENTRPVIRHALSIARMYNAKIIMLHVVEPMSSAMKAVVETYLTEIDAKKVQRDGMQAVLGRMKERLAKFCGEELESHSLKNARVSEILVVSGKISEEIIRVAEEHLADLIVIGKSTRNIMGSEVVGSVARRVPRYSHIPVIIVPNT